jgi:hypothetical protein
MTWRTKSTRLSPPTGEKNGCDDGPLLLFGLVVDRPMRRAAGPMESPTTRTCAITLSKEPVNRRRCWFLDLHRRRCYYRSALVVVTLGGVIANIMFRTSAKLYYGWPSLPPPPGGDVSHNHGDDHHHYDSINARDEEAPVVADTGAGPRGDDHDDSSMWCLRHQSKEPSPPKCGRLRRRTLWLEGYELRSNVAQSIRARQFNCSNDVATFALDNDYGLGSHLYQWSQAFCTADELGYRLLTYNPQWLWRDQEYCNGGGGVRFNHNNNNNNNSVVAPQPPQDQSESPFACYFPGMENHQCVDNSVVLPEKDPQQQQPLFQFNVTSPHDKRRGCSKARDETQLPMLRAGAIENIFSNVSSLVVQEAERQVALLFGGDDDDGGNHPVIPDDLITVHIRYGDKFWEMDLVPIDEYVQAVHELLRRRRDSGRYGENDHNNSNGTVHIYLATEDPRAYEEFVAAVPHTWRVYVDRTVTELAAFRPSKGNRASWTTRNTQGRAGLMTVASLLIALEANDFVLTTQSNWSRLLNDLRTMVLDPRCGNCTNAIDLRPGIW